MRNCDKDRICRLIARLVVHLCTFILFMCLLGGMLSFFVGCKAQQVVETQHDSVRVEYKTEYVADTIYYTLPHIHDAVVTKDTTSMLKNDYSQSYAAIIDGFLFHTLDVIPVSIPVETQKEIRYVDRVKTQKVQVTKYRDRVPNWIKIGFFSLFISFILLIYILWYFAKTRHRQHYQH